MAQRHAPKSPAISERRIWCSRDAGDGPTLDPVAVEEPLELRAGDRPLAVIMRTPGADFDLIRGFLWSEGLVRPGEALPALARPAESDLRPSERGNVVVVDLARDRAEERMAQRNLSVSSSCGVCGAAALAAIDEIARPIRSDLTLSRSVLLSLPETLRAHQKVFDETGGLHASGLFRSDGSLIAVREDVGRHNAVDKLVGWALAEGALPLGDAVLCVSGRVSYEIVSKALLAGLPILAAVSAPSSLAVDMAERYRMTLCAFVRPRRFNLYTHRQRISPS